MSYSAFGILAIVIHVIINQETLWKRKKNASAAYKAYRDFLFAILAFYIIDALWGILDATKHFTLLYADTVVYFAEMAATVLLWTRYVINYLDKRGAFSTALTHAGRVYFAFLLVMLAVNFYRPVLFWFDADGTYHAGAAHYTSLFSQIALFLLTSAYTLSVMGKTEGSVRRRHRTIGLFGIVMTLFVGAQVAYPLLPLYSMGYLIGGCLVHAFVVEDEKEDYRRELENTLAQMREQKQELGTAMRLAYTDPLTRVKSKHAYAEKEAQLDQDIAGKAAEPFAIAVFDLNGLKRINDTLGHEVGDQYIIAACRMICNHFKHSPVYRVGGDEFAAVLEGEDYRNREALQSAFDARIRENLRGGRVVVASGIAEYEPGRDLRCRMVFDRADEKMYRNKRILKELEGL